MRLKTREAWTGLAFAALPVGGVAVFFVYPFAVAVGLSFMGGPGNRQFTGLENYVEVLASDAFRIASFNTFKFIGLGVPLILAVSLLLAVPLSEKVAGWRWFRSLYILPLVVPTASIILVFRILFERSGVINSILAARGAAPVDFFGADSGAPFWVLVLLYIWKNLGYNIVLFLAALSAVPKEYYEAAKVDGAGGLRCFVRITLPAIGPSVFFVTVISIINAFRSFREVFVLAGNYPSNSIYMLQHYMNNNFGNANYQHLSVAAFLTFLVILSFVAWMHRARQKTGDLEL